MKSSIHISCPAQPILVAVVAPIVLLLLLRQRRRKPVRSMRKEKCSEEGRKLSCFFFFCFTSCFLSAMGRKNIQICFLSLSLPTPSLYRFFLPFFFFSFPCPHFVPQIGFRVGERVSSCSSSRFLFVFFLSPSFSPHSVF